MSARAERRRQARAESKAECTVGYSIVAGWCASEAELDEAKKGTHDIVIGMAGDRRRGGVQWRIASGADATQILSQLREPQLDNELELNDYYRRIAAMLREFGGFLVVAMCPAVQPS